MQNEPTNQDNGAKYEIDLTQIPEATLKGHMWRQEGIQLICQSCTFRHATFIEPGYQLYEIDKDGQPLIRKITVKDSYGVRLPAHPGTKTPSSI